MFPKEKDKILRQQIYYWKKQGWIKTLKNGLYQIIYPQQRNIPDLFVANKLYFPSYVSLETALSYYSIIPDVAMGVTSVTAKPTREFRNNYGFFRYRTIKNKAFIGYRIIEEDRFKIKIAESEKAFVDYIYFKLYDGDKIDIDAERFNLNAIRKFKRTKLHGYAVVFGKKTSTKVKELYAKS